MEGKKEISNSSIHDFIGGIVNPDSFPIKNGQYASYRKKAYEELMAITPSSLTDVFGKEHEDTFTGIKNLSLVNPPSACFNPSITKKNETIAGKQVIGKVFVTNAEIHYSLDASVQEKGVVLCDLLSASSDHSEIFNQISDKESDINISPLSNLINSQRSHGAFLYVPEKIKLDGVLKIEISSDIRLNSLILIHLITLMGRSSSGNIFFDISTINEDTAQSFLVIQSEMILMEDSTLNILENQRFSNNSVLFLSEKIVQAKNSTINEYINDQGSAVLDRFLRIDMDGEGSEAKITAIYNPENCQRYFYDTLQNHRSSFSTSDLLFKGVLGKDAYSKWKGNILVERETFGANGFQTNNILLMDESAIAESIPGLEILTDDVRCSHGVTMGNIDKDQMFYLQSRGINKYDAENLIVSGFFLSTAKRFKDKDFGKYIQNTFES